MPGLPKSLKIPSLGSLKVRARTINGFRDDEYKCRRFRYRLYLVQLLIGEKETLFCFLQILLQPLYTPEDNVKSTLHKQSNRQRLRCIFFSRNNEESHI
jgi:hypothetical protein